MNIYEEVKIKSNIVDVASAIGIKLSRSNKALCPFHNKKTPSFSISSKKQVFKCFGCGQAGDSITLVAKLKNFTNYESAIYINELLNLGVEVSNPNFTNKYKNNKPDKISNYNNSKVVVKAFEKWENDTFLLLSDYRRYLADKNDEETAQMLDIVDYYLDIFICGDMGEKVQFYKNNKKVVQSINERFSKRNN